jgi:hypothetical protein
MNEKWRPSYRRRAMAWITEDQYTFEREDDPRLRHFLKIAVMASK